tara:strand:- start:3669 stop:4331 length:663 start_codon:yes stop_codon:yes gene_type:complete
MLYFAKKFLKDGSHKNLRKRLMLSDSWIDGKLSAKGLTKEIKKNVELNAYSDDYTILSEEIIQALKDDSEIKTFAYPFKVFNILFTRTGKGMYYGPHIDLANSELGRRDFSFTVFLNNPDEYKGGELILNIPPEKKTIKLNAGEIIIYPTKYLHEVKEVKEGERLVCVGWIESEISNNEDRESLSMLQIGLSELIKIHGNSSHTMTMMVAINNIYKRFVN